MHIEDIKYKSWAKSYVKGFVLTVQPIFLLVFFHSSEDSGVERLEEENPFL